MPFVSDTFHTFSTVGFPVDMRPFELTRKFFNWAYRLLLQDLRDAMTKQANLLLSEATELPLPVIESLARIRDGLTPSGVTSPGVLPIGSTPGFCSDSSSSTPIVVP